MASSLFSPKIKTRVVSFVHWFFNAFFFYLGWLVCMYAAVGEYPILGPLVVGGILLYHFVVSKEKKADFILCVTLAVLGTIVDSLYMKMGMLSYKGGYFNFPNIAPLWIVSLWVLYGTSVNHSLKWMRCSVFVAAILGAAGAISSYLVGVELGAVKFLWKDELALTVIGFVWAIVVPSSLHFGFRLKNKD